MIRCLPLVWAGLWRKPSRMVITVLCVVTAFLLFGVLYGVTSAFDEVIGRMSDMRLRIQSRANIMEGLPLAHLRRIENVNGVTAVAYYTWFGGQYQDPRNQVEAGAIDVGRLSTLYPELRVADHELRAMAAMRTGVLVGRDLAARFGWQVGDRVPLISQMWQRQDGSVNWIFDIVGIYEFSDSLPSNELFINYDYFDAERAAGQGTVMLYFARISDPGRSADIAEAVDALFANSLDETQTQSEKDWIRAQVSQLGDIDFFVNAIVGAVLFTLLFLTANTMMQSVRERVPEFAVLKTYGFGDGLVLTLVFAEGVLLCVTAAALGLVAASTVFPGIYTNFGVGRIPLPWNVVAVGLGLALLLALVSAVAPAWRAQKLNVVDALARR